jgi:D-glycero-D-manno-heptose 1,7-bisphosphate phosphatase
MNNKLHPAVFLDRDGVICRTFIRNGKPYAPSKMEDFKLMPNSHHSVMLLKQEGFKVIVVTNQPDIGNGIVALEVVESMHQKLRKKSMVDDVILCAHRQDEGCECRKPRPGMLIHAANKHGIDLNKSFMIGDRASDIEAGKNAGCRTVFIDRHYAEPPPLNPETTVNSLQKAVAYIITNNKNKKL